MKPIEGRNNVKVYNLSLGRSLPDWLKGRRKRDILKRDTDLQNRIELIQDFRMPDESSCVKVSPDGRYILATGKYTPRVKCFEVASLSLKFERCIDYEAVDFEILSEDYSKLVFLQEYRYVELHYQGGRWFRVRIPKAGRDLAYHYPTCDLYLAASGSEVYRLNLHQGRFMTSLQTESTGVNKCTFNKVHYLFTCGTDDGRVEAWDPRSRHRVGVLDCAVHMDLENVMTNDYKGDKKVGITSLAYNDALTLGVGTQTGQVLLYDIRSNKPLLVKDHNDGLPIKDLEFHNSAGMVLSMSPHIVKIWDKNTGAPHTSIESTMKFNDLCLVPDSGMLFLATVHSKLQTYFLPSLGTAPKWCAHLDALIEELEEEEAPTQYDDYKFVTQDELKQLGLEDLIGTQMLRAVMHGYYMDSRLYNKAKLIANPFDYDDFVKRKVKQKISEQNQRVIPTKKLVDVNQDLYEALLTVKEEETTKPTKSQKASKVSILEDDRFKDLFKSEEFHINKSSEEYKSRNPVLKNDKKHKKRKAEEEYEEEEFLNARESLLNNASDSESDNELKTKVSENKTKTQNSKVKTPETKRKKKEKKEDMVDRVQIQDSSQEREKLKKLRKLPVTNDERSKKDLSFIAGNTLTELSYTKKKLSKIPLSERLELEDENQESMKQMTFGSREMTYTVKNKKASKYEEIQKQRKDHVEERKRLCRTSAGIKGKIRSKSDFM